MLRAVAPSAAGERWTAYLALGSNLGDRLGYLRAAVRALESGAPDAAVQVEARSPVFETDAVADDPQPPYLNAVIRVSTALDARALLARCLDVEQALGRVRPGGKTGTSRTIDIDLLLHQGTPVVREPGLVVPHPRLLDRPFVRQPLARAAAPGLTHPLTGAALDQAPPATSSVRLYSENW
jgi:2-amino-4-hydroxy-6-hydroxymethyldihydropteridine diphosphokinase